VACRAIASDRGVLLGIGQLGFLPNFRTGCASLIISPFLLDKNVTNHQQNQIQKGDILIEARKGTFLKRFDDGISAH
jgi:hypothetical protein